MSRASNSTTSPAFQARLRNRIGNRGEDIIDVRSGLGARLEEEQGFFLGVGFCFSFGYLSRVRVGFRFAGEVVCFCACCRRVVAASGRWLDFIIPFDIGAEVEFVADKGDDDPGRGLALKFGYPVLGFDEGGGFCEVIDYEGGLGVAVVHWREGGKSFLAGCVPDFEFDDSIWEGDLLGEEGG